MDWFFLESVSFLNPPRRKFATHDPSKQQEQPDDEKEKKESLSESSKTENEQPPINPKKNHKVEEQQQQQRQQQQQQQAIRQRQRQQQEALRQRQQLLREQRQREQEELRQRQQERQRQRRQLQRQQQHQHYNEEDDEATVIVSNNHRHPSPILPKKENDVSSSPPTILSTIPSKTRNEPTITFLSFRHTNTLIKAQAIIRGYLIRRPYTRQLIIRRYIMYYLPHQQLLSKRNERNKERSGKKNKMDILISLYFHNHTLQNPAIHSILVLQTFVRRYLARKKFYDTAQTVVQNQRHRHFRREQQVQFLSQQIMINKTLYEKQQVKKQLQKKDGPKKKKKKKQQQRQRKGAAAAESSPRNVLGEKKDDNLIRGGKNGSMTNGTRTSSSSSSRPTTHSKNGKRDTHADTNRKTKNKGQQRNGNKILQKKKKKKDQTIKKHILNVVILFFIQKIQSLARGYLVRKKHTLHRPYRILGNMRRKLLYIQHCRKQQQQQQPNDYPKATLPHVIKIQAIIRGYLIRRPNSINNIIHKSILNKKYLTYCQKEGIRPYTNDRPSTTTTTTSDNSTTNTTTNSSENGKKTNQQDTPTTNQTQQQILLFQQQRDSTTKNTSRTNNNKNVLFNVNRMVIQIQAVIRGYLIRRPQSLQNIIHKYVMYQKYRKYCQLEGIDPTAVVAATTTTTRTTAGTTITNQQQEQNEKQQQQQQEIYKFYRDRNSNSNNYYHYNNNNNAVAAVVKKPKTKKHLKKQKDNVAKKTRTTSTSRTPRLAVIEEQPSNEEEEYQRIEEEQEAQSIIPKREEKADRKISPISKAIQALAENFEQEQKQLAENWDQEQKQQQQQKKMQIQKQENGINSTEELQPIAEDKAATIIQLRWKMYRKACRNKEKARFIVKTMIQAKFPILSKQISPTNNRQEETKPKVKTEKTKGESLDPTASVATSTKTTLDDGNKNVAAANNIMKNIQNQELTTIIATPKPTQKQNEINKKMDDFEQKKARFDFIADSMRQQIAETKRKKKVKHATVIQAIVRAYLSRRSIKSNAHRELRILQDRRSKIKGILLFQAIVRGFLIRRPHRIQEFIKQHEQRKKEIVAINLIQANIRGYLYRKSYYFPPLAVLFNEYQHQQTQLISTAAVIIQRRWRLYKQLDREKENRLLLIQSKWNLYQERCKRVKEAAMLLQGTWKLYKQKCKERDEAAIVIQRNWRVYEQCRKQENSVLLLQSMWRMYKVRRARKERIAAQIIQSKWLYYRKRRELQQAAASLIQIQWRLYRMRYQEKKVAARTIQFRWRLYKNRCEEIEMAAIIIQSAWDFYKIKRRLMFAIITVQIKWCLYYKRLRKKQKIAATLIQRRWRFYRKHCMKEKRAAVVAGDILQSKWPFLCKQLNRTTEVKAKEPEEENNERVSVMLPVAPKEDSSLSSGVYGGTVSTLKNNKDTNLDNKEYNKSKRSDVNKEEPTTKRMGSYDHNNMNDMVTEHNAPEEKSSASLGVTSRSISTLMNNEDKNVNSKDYNNQKNNNINKEVQTPEGMESTHSNNKNNMVAEPNNKMVAHVDNSKNRYSKRGKESTVRSTREQILERKRQRKLALIKIQAVVRGYVIRCRFTKQKNHIHQIKIRSITIIQAHFRGFLQRNQSKKELSAAILIQGIVRGYLLRIRCPLDVLVYQYRQQRNMLFAVAVCIIEKRWLLYKKKCKEKEDAAILLQAKWRLYKKRCKKQQVAAISLQQTWRSYNKRCQKKSAAILLQFKWRVYLKRCKQQELAANAIQSKWRFYLKRCREQEAAATVLQREWRLYEKRCLEQVAAVVLLQFKWRAFLKRRMEEKKAAGVAAGILQSKYPFLNKYVSQSPNSMKEVKLAHEQFKRKIYLVTKVQALFRGHAMRRPYRVKTLVRQYEKQCSRLREVAAIVIQVRVREYLLRRPNKMYGSINAYTAFRATDNTKIEHYQKEIADVAVDNKHEKHILLKEEEEGGGEEEGRGTIRSSKTVVSHQQQELEYLNVPQKSDVNLEANGEKTGNENLKLANMPNTYEVLNPKNLWQTLRQGVTEEFRKGETLVDGIMAIVAARKRKRAIVSIQAVIRGWLTRRPHRMQDFVRAYLDYQDKKSRIDTAATGTGSPSGVALEKQKRTVGFDRIQMRLYDVVIGDHPSCKTGYPLALGWDYAEDDLCLSINEYESSRQSRRSRKSLRMPLEKRREVLLAPKQSSPVATLPGGVYPDYQHNDEFDDSDSSDDDDGVVVEDDEM